METHELRLKLETELANARVLHHKQVDRDDRVNIREEYISVDAVASTLTELKRIFKVLDIRKVWDDNLTIIRKCTESGVPSPYREIAHSGIPYYVVHITMEQAIIAIANNIKLAVNTIWYWANSCRIGKDYYSSVNGRFVYEIEVIRRGSSPYKNDPIPIVPDERLIEVFPKNDEQLERYLADPNPRDVRQSQYMFDNAIVMHDAIPTTKELSDLIFSAAIYNPSTRGLHLWTEYQIYSLISVVKNIKSFIYRSTLSEQMILDISSYLYWHYRWDGVYNGRMWLLDIMKRYRDLSPEFLEILFCDCSEKYSFFSYVSSYQNNVDQKWIDDMIDKHCTED